jgi:Sulfotransferase family
LETAHDLLADKYPYLKEKPKDERRQPIFKIFQKGFWPEPSYGLDTMIPVFLVGIMRSGSTLTETMLDAHRNIYGMGEYSVLQLEVDKLRLDMVEAYQSSSNPARDFEKAVKKYAKIIVSGMQEVARNATAGVARYGAIKRVVDKYLWNYERIGFIHLMFPKAVILHTVRDPMDTLLSMYKNKFVGNNIEYTWNYKHMVHEYALYLRVMSHFRKQLPGRIIDVSYEQLVKSPEKVMRGVLSALKLDWDPNVLEFHSTNRNIQTLSMRQVQLLLYLCRLYRRAEYCVCTRIISRFDVTSK